MDKKEIDMYDNIYKDRKRLSEFIPWPNYIKPPKMKKYLLKVVLITGIMMHKYCIKIINCNIYL